MDPYKIIPADACLVLESAGLPDLMNTLSGGNRLFGELINVKELDELNKKIKYLTDLVNKVEFKKLFNGTISLISFHATDNGKLVPLLSMNVPPEIRFRHIHDILHTVLGKELIIRSQRPEKTIVIPYTLLNKRDTVYLSFVSGLLICSSSETLIKEAIKQKDIDTGIKEVPGFLKTMVASGKNEDKVFIVFRNLSKVMQFFSGEKAAGLSRSISKLAGSAEGDIYFNEEGLVLSGFTESTDSTESLYKFKSYAPGTLEVLRVLPSITVLFETILLPEQNLGPGRGTIISDSTSALGKNLIPFLEGEITRAYLEIKECPAKENTVFVYKLKNRERVEKYFEKPVVAQNFEKLIKGSSYIQYFQPDDQIKIPIYSTQFNGLISTLVPGFVHEAQDSLVTFYDNFMITGNSYKTLSRFLYDDLLNKTLLNDMTFRDFNGTLPSRAGYFFYCVPSKIIEYLSGFINENIIKVLNSNINSLRKIQAIGYQFAASNGMLYNTISLRFKEEVREESGTEWETLLDTAACTKPFFFTNHITGAKEIFLQDLKNTAYLINSAGRILWKVPLGERINGNVYMIDYFRNGKFQLLFSGKNFLHLLDRNGNYVERYPVRLRSPASGPLALFDYDNNLEYRLVIPGEDKLIYEYDKTGSVVKGWKQFRTNGNVRNEVRFFRVSGKDYIIASDETSVYILDRTGNIKLNVKETVTRAPGSELRLTNGSDKTLVFSSPDGTLQFVSFDGTVRKITLNKFSYNHSFDFFDVDGDGFGEYLFIDRGKLYLYDHDKSEIFTRNFGSDDLSGPINFMFSASDRKIGVFDNKKKLIYLIDKKGDTMNGFPLRGTSVFSIGKVSEKSGYHLIVGGNDNFLYNYKLNTESK